ncbi:MAG TPA: nitrilase-related carbon-nitrogen hydrolase [Alphaproteobacteria bacterium]
MGFGFRVTQASLNQTALDWPRNMGNIYAAIDQAIKDGSDVLALAELDLTGYEANDEFQRTDNTRVLEALDDIAAYANAKNPNLIISVGHPWRVQKRDLRVEEGLSFERTKEPLYDRLNLPFNVQSLITGGRIVGMTAKSNLYNDGRGYEKRYFNEWSVAAANRIGGVYGTIDIALDDKRVIPFGRPIIQITDGDRTLNLTQAICEEKWVASKYDGQPWTDDRYENDNIIPSISKYLGSTSGLVLIIPNASPPARDKIDRHVHLDKLAAQYADLVIDTDGLGSSGSTFAQFGHRLIVQGGKLVSQGARMSFERVATTTATVMLGNAPSDTESRVHAITRHEFKNAYNMSRGKIVAGWDSPDNPNRHFEEVIRYTAFWLFDYMRKTGSKGIMEALSGGADSAFNSVIVAVMVRMGVQELGIARFCEELNLPHADKYIGEYLHGNPNNAIDDLMDFFLTGVYMGTNNSSRETHDAAEFLIKGGRGPITGEIVKGIGGKFLERNVQDLLDFYGTMYAVENLQGMKSSEKQAIMTDIAGYLNASPHTTTKEERAEKAANLKAKYPQIQDLVTAADGVAYENIQARGREVLIMLFANKENKMAVANPNLDEARNAYATFGGDLHSGTINLNGHLPKAYQLKVMEYLYEHGLQGVMGPVRSLGLVLKNKPSAELQPKSADGKVVQTDESALQRTFAQMDFIAEKMLYAQFVDGNGARRLNAGEVFTACQSDALFKGVSDNMLYNMLRLSYHRWTIAQHKIHASPIAPTFGSNVDHQTSQRTPNLHGESKDELTQLGINILFDWAERDGLDWSQTQKQMLRKYAWQSEGFVKRFGAHTWGGLVGQDYDLTRLYRELKEKGWGSLFPELTVNHPLKVIYPALQAA